MENLTIGQLAKESKVNVETVRYYERRGLIPKPPLPKTGYRQYSRDIISRILFIKRAQELGFTLKEISELLYLRVDPGRTCADVKKRAEIKIADIEGKIRTLESIKKALTRLVALCTGRGPTGECPIIEVLDTKGVKGQ
jgi:MerR family mercuric resistance operon transcriptional regulator